MPEQTMLQLGIDDIHAAAERIAPYVHKTPVLSSQAINQLAGCELYFKCENLQRCGAFKARGAHNAILQLDAEQASRGVATHSSGNHGAALSLAAQQLGCKAYIVMPNNSSQAKIDSVKRYGGILSFCEPGTEAREAAVADLIEQTGARLIPPYDSPQIIAGQGTAALELCEQLDQPLDALIAPIGGGGLLAGTAIAGRASTPGVELIGAEPAGADDAYHSHKSRVWQPQTQADTIADGLRSSTGQLTFRIICDLVDDIIRVEDSDTVSAMQLIWSCMKQVVEPSSAITLAAVLGNRERFAGKRLGLILTGGNVDLQRLPWL